MTLPILLKSLTSEQKLRVLALDYVTASGFVGPDEWCHMARAVEIYLSEGEIKSRHHEACVFPTVIKSE